MPPRLKGLIDRMSHNELPKVIDKSQADIDAAIAAIIASEIEGSAKDFAISGYQHGNRTQIRKFLIFL